MNRILAIISLIVLLSACSKEVAPNDPNAILYGEWQAEFYFESIWENGDTNYIVPDSRRFTFLPNGKAEIYKRVGTGMALERIDSIYYKINEARDTFSYSVFYQFNKYQNLGFISFTPRQLDTFSMDYFSYTLIFSNYFEDIDKTANNYLKEEFYRQ